LKTVGKVLIEIIQIIIDTGLKV